MRKELLVIAAMLLLFSFVSGGWSIVLSGSNIQKSATDLNHGELIRFHVIANSDSPYDQNLKLKVRDAVLDYLGPMLKEASSTSGAREVIARNGETIIRISDRILAENGVAYRTNIDIGTFEFPVKTYGAFTVPAGEYEAVRILLGEASGKNWWCVLFPPLCFIDVNSTVAAQPVSAAVESGAGVQKQNPIEFKWKLKEILSSNIQLPDRKRH